MNLQQQEAFYQVMTNGRLKSSRAASSAEARVTEMVNGLLVSKPANPKEPVVIDLQECAKSKSRKASVPNINKLKAIQDFINGKD